MVGLVQGTPNLSANNASVTDRVAQALPVTLQLTFYGLDYRGGSCDHPRHCSAVYRDKWPDQVIRVFSIAAIATPSFWLAVLMILLFSSMLHVLPRIRCAAQLCARPGWLARPHGDARRYRLAIPSLASSLVLFVPPWSKNSIKTTCAPRLAPAFRRGVVIGRNVLRNALITPVTVLGLRIGYLIGGAVVIEVIFNLPGMGMAILSGIQSNYTMLVQGVVLVVAVTFIIINIVVDMLYILIDPRIRTV